MGSGIVDLWNKGTGIKLQMEVNEQKLFDTNNSESVERNPLQDVPSKVVAGSVKDSKPETDTKIREFRFESEKYCEAVDMWPQRGRHIMAQYTDKAILVYQAFKPEIAEYATLHQSFEGCKSYKTTRMTWIKTNFLWMMYRSGWACKKNQEVILGIWIKRNFFERLLRAAKSTQHGKYAKNENGSKCAKGNKPCRLQWDPDHLPRGEKHLYRKAIQIGIKGELAEEYASGKGKTPILKITDVTPFVREQSRILNKSKEKQAHKIKNLWVARERIFAGLPEDLAQEIRLSECSKVS
mmetsp:Transcript_15362/g.21490  ORF Transcript_15362/g.21490 Transcript_15362/m.21490 type:complete len:295 (-) Transcript_15362:134-1018(-)|eukprot:jgi/Bigna1/90304/estExt_fgenesh1_pg.C_670016